MSVILYKMLEYHAPSSSVLYGNSTTAALKYFFAIQTVMPTFRNRLASDPIRVLAQMTMTGPFYAGVAYSLGALLRKHRPLTKIFVFEKPDEPAREQDAQPTPRAL
jgi:hypothetical protein